MSPIRRIAPRRCPDCNAQNTLFIADDRQLTCSLCGYKDAIDTADADETGAADDDPRSRWPVSYGTPYTSDISRWAKTKFYSAMDYYNRGEFDEAMTALRDALDEMPDFIDAHLWLARIARDPDIKREHYSEVLAQMANNLEAVRELMVLNGQLSRSEADRTMGGRESVVVDAQHPVKAQMVDVTCGSCGGSLQADADQGEVRCQFCGHVEQVPTLNSDSDGPNSLTMALLKERGKGVKWNVGSHMLHCDNCGAERVITKRQMSHECPFCGSDQVIRTDALDSFRQPDGIVPFAINKRNANEALDEALGSFTEKLKGFFVNNRVDSVRLTPVYLPFWLFDVIAQVIRTQTNKQSGRTLAAAQAAVQRQEHGDTLRNIPLCGVTSPSQHLTRRLDNFDLERSVAYDPRRLANVSAELYTLDFQKASLAIRNDIQERFRFRHGHNEYGDVQVRVSAMIQQMSFRLLLMPIWVATIREADDDVRVALIHGQTAQVILGRAQKPDA